MLDSNLDFMIQVYSCVFPLVYLFGIDITFYILFYYTYIYYFFIYYSKYIEDRENNIDELFIDYRDINNVYF